jgi:hypothetical protein
LTTGITTGVLLRRALDGILWNGIFNFNDTSTLVDLGFRSRNDFAFFSLSSQLLTIKASGNVGIGTTTPSGTLTIQGSDTTNGQLSLSNTTGGPTKIINQGNGDTFISSLATVYFGNYSPVNSLKISNAGAVQQNSSVNSYFTGTGNFGISTTTPGSKLTVAGAINSTDLLGGVTTLSTDANGNIIRTPSDQKLKTNVETITSALDKVNHMRGVSYNWIDTNRFGTSTEIGFVAQELETVVPEVVKSGGEYKSVNYQNLVALLTEAIKELSHKVDTFAESIKTKFLDADKVKTKELCIGDTCITEEEFKQVLQNRSTSSHAPTPSPAPVVEDVSTVVEQPAAVVSAPDPVVEAPVVEVPSLEAPVEAPVI